MNIQWVLYLLITLSRLLFIIHHPNILFNGSKRFIVSTSVLLDSKGFTNESYLTVVEIR